MQPGVQASPAIRMMGPPTSKPQDMPTQAKESRSQFEASERYYEYLGKLSSEAMLEKVEKGELAGPAPLGYRSAYARDEKVEIDGETAPLVRQAFLLLAMPNASLRAARGELLRLGLRSKRGRPISVSSLQHLATNPFYAGLIRYRGRLYPGAHQPLIPLRLFQRVQENLRARNTNRTPRT